MENTFSNDIQKLLASKGLTVVQEVNNMDEITYSQKKSIDLIAVVSFDITPTLNITTPSTCHTYPVLGLVCTNEEGDIRLNGKVYVSLLEPMSKEKIIIKTIDISSIASSGGIVSFHYVGSDSALDSMYKLMNKDYPVLMSSMSKALDGEEIQANLKDIKDLKRSAK